MHATRFARVLLFRSVKACLVTCNNPSSFTTASAVLMSHLPRYSFKRVKRLAHDSGVFPATVSRIMRGQSKPSYAVMLKITKALEVALGKSLDMPELVREDREYPTTFICSLVGCYGCLPVFAYTHNDQMRAKYRDWRPGYWTGDISEEQEGVWHPIKEIQE